MSPTPPSPPTTKPIVILVPGAWHPPSCFDLLASGLRSHGYKTVQVTTPTVGNLSVPFSADVAAVRSAIETAISAGEDVLLFMHSYGGVPGSCAVEGLMKARDEDGKRRGVVGLIYCTSWVLDVGETVLGNPIARAVAAGGTVKARGVSDDPVEVYGSRGGVERCFYGDLTEEEQRKWTGMLKRQKYETVLMSEVTYAAWRDVQSTYIYCMDDQAITFETQRALVERAREERVEMKTITLKASDSPFLSMPEKVVDAIRTVAGENVELKE